MNLSTRTTGAPDVNPLSRTLRPDPRTNSRAVVSVRTRASLAAAAILFAACPGASFAQPAKSDKPPPSSPSPTAPSPGKPPPPASDPARAKPARAPITNADELLRTLETADSGLRTLRADIKYVKQFGPLAGNDIQEWRGKLYFSSSPVSQNSESSSAPGPSGESPARRFAVNFTSFIVDAVRRDEDKTHIFDGQYYVEKTPADRTFIKRQIVTAEEAGDPLRIGEGPFPIPIGQRRADILARFTATLEASDAGCPPEAARFVAETYQLHLVPKPDTDIARDFKDIRLWYRASDLLPRMARTVNVNDTVADVLLINLERNAELDPAIFDTSTPPPDAGWDVQVQDLRVRTEVKPPAASADGESTADDPGDDRSIDPPTPSAPSAPASSPSASPGSDDPE